MKRVIVIALIFVVLVAAALVYFTSTRPAPKAANLLPDTTLLFIETPDFPRTRAEFRNTAAYALCNEPEVQAFLEEPRRRLAEALGFATTTQEQPGIGDMLSGIAQGEVFLAITHISVAPNLQPGLVLGVDTKRKHLEAAAALTYYERSLAQQNPPVKVADTKYLGISYTIWNLRPDLQLCHAFFNSMLVFTLGENVMRDVITRFTGQAASDAPSLASGAKYQNVLQHLPNGHALVAYVNVEQLMGLVGPFLALASQGGGALEKLARIQATATGVTFTENQIQDVGYTAYSTAAPPPPATQRKTLALTTPQTALYSCASSDLSAVYRETMDSIVQSGIPALANGVAQFERLLAQRGVRIREDALAMLGSETAIVALWREDARFPEVALVADVNDPQESRAPLDAAMDALKQVTVGGDEQFPWEQTQHLGETLHSVRLAAGIVTPTYVVTDKFFILSLTPDYARELVAQLRQPGPTLTANTDYAQATKRLPSDASAYFYCDLRRVIGALYTLAHANVGTNQFVGLAKLPKTETIIRCLGPFASATVTTDKSETSVSFSPLGKPLTIAVAAVGGLVASQPYLAQLPINLTPGVPTTSSDAGVPHPPRGNQTAPSQTPAPQ